MFSFRTTPIEDQLDRSLVEGRVACFCTQNCWDPVKGRYLFDIFKQRGNLVKVFIPRDSELTPDTNHIEFDAQDLEGLDAVVVEIQDVGTRYFNYTRDVMQLLSWRARNFDGPSIYIIDHINPAGRLVEGSMPVVDPGLWIPKVAHRHGLTLGELCSIYYEQIDAHFPLHVISARCSDVGKDLMPWTIAPSSDLPGMFSCEMYPGGGLWNGTNITPAIGTSRPYEYFGAPFIKLEDIKYLPTPQGVMMRSCSFTPAYGRYSGERCFGYQIMLQPGARYHSLLHTLLLMRHFADRYSEFEMYDHLFTRIADPVVEEYLRGRLTFDVVQEHIKSEEQKWIRKAKRFLLYDDAPYRIK